MRYLFSFVFVLAFCVMGCSEESCGVCPCPRPLDDYCEGSACSSWERALAYAEKFAVAAGCDCGLWPVAFDAGRCGDLLFVRWDCGDTHVEYFDGSETLVAAYWWTDTSACGQYYGFRPECALEQEQDFCDQLPELTCCHWCLDEPEGPSCHQGPPESVQDCFQDCFESYTREEEESGCGYAWLRIKACEMSSPDEGGCDYWKDALARCQANSYCETNCPTQDRQECIEQYLTTGVCET